MDRPYFCAYHSYLEALEPLNDAEKGRLFVACLTYSMTGEVPQLSGNERFVFPSLRGQIDRDKARFAELDRKQAENGRKGGRPRKKPKEPENEGESSPKPKKPTAFSENPKNPPVFLETQKSQEKDIEKDIKETEDNDSLRSSSSSAKKDDDDSTPENTWTSLGLGQRVGPAVSQALRDYRAKGVEDALIVQVMHRTAEYSTSAPLPYMRRILDQAVAAGQLTLDTWQSAHSTGHSAKRVDRATPSGVDFLADAMNRPRRHKRTG